jgi:hypothetical protein
MEDVRLRQEVLRLPLDPLPDALVALPASRWRPPSEPDHAVYVEDVLIPIRHLINGSTIAQVAADRVAHCHLERKRCAATTWLLEG